MNNRKSRRRAAKLSRSANAATAAPKTAGFSAPRWQAALLGTVAAGTLITAQPRGAYGGPAACTTSGSVATCRGNQSNGITNIGGTPDFTSPPVETLNVNGLDRNIAPTGAGISGITFASLNDVTINSDTGAFKIRTTALGAAGILAYSLGGSVTVTQTGDMSTKGNYADTIYAIATGGAVAITQTGDMTTRGRYAAGIYAVSTVDAVTVTQTGDITTEKFSSDGIYAYAFGGKATVTQSGTITTGGNVAPGIYARSVVDAAVVRQTGSISTTGNRSDGIFAASNYDAVTITQTGDVTTTGFRSYGIGGGASDDVTITQTGTVTTKGRRADAIYAYSVAGAVTITQTGAIKTMGNRSEGILGVAGDGPVTIDQTGDVVTTGRDAEGVFAVAGGDNNVTVATNGRVVTRGNSADAILTGSDGGRIRITHSGIARANGDGSDAIDVNNTTGVGSSRVVITAGSRVVGGRGTGDGIDFDGGKTNRVINRGTITTQGENAIDAGVVSREIIDNYGTVTGNIDLGSGADVFNNHQDGTFNTGKRVDLGTGELLWNAGTLAPGGSGTLRTSTLTGRFRQTADGVFKVDVNHRAGKSDRLDVSGTAKLDGTVLPKLSRIELTPKARRFTILSADGGTTDNGLSVADSGAIDYSLLYPNAEDVVLAVRLDFTPTGHGLTPNQRAAGNHLNRILHAGVPKGLKPLYRNLLTFGDTDSLAAGLDQLHAEPYLSQYFSTYLSSETFAQSLLSCPVADGSVVIGAEGQCVWARAHGRRFDQDRSRPNIGIDETAAGLAGGVQFAFDDIWRAGLAVGYENAWAAVDTRANATSDRFHFGGSLKGVWGATTLAATLSGGLAETELRRDIRLPGLRRTAVGDQDIGYAAARVRLAHSFSFGGSGLYARPQVDFGATFIDLGGVNERGAGGAGLAVAGRGEWLLSATPALEVGGRFVSAGGTRIEPYGRVGATFLSEDDAAINARFRGAPAGVAPMVLTTGYDDVLAAVDVGANVVNADGTSLKINYSGLFGADTRAHSGAVKFTVAF